MTSKYERLGTVRLKHLTRICLICALGFMSSCGLGDDDDDLQAPEPAPELVGTWCGPGQDSGGSLGTLCMEIDADGRVQVLQLNGTSVGGEGVIQLTASPRLYRFYMAEDDIQGFLAISDSGAHVAYLDNYSTFGALDNFSDNLPTYSRASMRGSWAGYSWYVDSDGNQTEGTFSDLHVDSEYEFEGSLEGDEYYSRSGFTVEITSSQYGLYQVRHEKRSGGVGITRFLMAPDRNAIAGYICDSGDVFPSSCALLMLDR